MQAVDVVNRLKEVVGKYNDDFVDLIGVTSLTRSGTTATLVTSTNHNLTSGDYITVRDAVNPITITSLTRVDDIVTVVTVTSTNLVDPSKYDINLQNSQTVTISGAVPSEYNGTFQLLSVADDRLSFTYKIATTPTTPATTEGFFLQADFDGYNGYKQVTVVDPTTFTYTVPDNLQSPAQGNIQVVSASRIAWGATIDRVKKFHEADTDRVQQNWMYVVLGSEVVYKDGTVASDIDSAVLQNEDYFFEPYQDIAIYIYLPSENEILGGFASDKARSLRNLVVKAIANFSFDSDLVEDKYQPTIYVGNEEDEYSEAFYVHRYDFAAKGFVQQEDTIDIDPGVPLEVVDGTFKDKDLIYKPRYK
jgi:hypothetical protein